MSEVSKARKSFIGQIATFTGRIQDVSTKGGWVALSLKEDIVAPEPEQADPDDAVAEQWPKGSMQTITGKVVTTAAGVDGGHQVTLQVEPPCKVGDYVRAVAGNSPRRVPNPIVCTGWVRHITSTGQLCIERTNGNLTISCYGNILSADRQP